MSTQYLYGNLSSRVESAGLAARFSAQAVRGRRGGIQPARLVGVVDHRDFVEQECRAKEDVRLRPDWIMHIPGGKQLVVDAKTPVRAYPGASKVGDDRSDENPHG